MKYSYNVVAEAMEKADKKINEVLIPIIQDFKTETRKILNLFDKACYTFNNEEEKNELIEKFEKALEKKNSSKYGDYIYMSYEIVNFLFMVDCYVMSNIYFVSEQRNKIAQNITVEL